MQPNNSPPPTAQPTTPLPASLFPPEPPRENFSQDFRRFFLRGLAALMPTLITLWVLIKVWDFLWQSIGIYIIMGLRRLMSASDHLRRTPGLDDIRRELSDTHNVPWYVQLTGVLLAIILVYLVGLYVGHFLGRASWRLAERAVMRVPLIRAIYPAVKQVTDFVLADRKSSQFAESRVVAVEPHAKGIWSIGLVTGSGIKRLSDTIDTEMLTVFVPSSPTAFSGYVLVVPRDSVIELPLTVEQAMRMLISGGVIDPSLVPQRAGGDADEKGVVASDVDALPPAEGSTPPLGSISAAQTTPAEPPRSRAAG